MTQFQVGGFLGEKFAVSTLSSVTLLSNSVEAHQATVCPSDVSSEHVGWPSRDVPSAFFTSVAFLCQVAMPSGQHADPNNSGAQSSSSPQGRC